MPGVSARPPGLAFSAKRQRAARPWPRAAELTECRAPGKIEPWRAPARPKLRPPDTGRAEASGDGMNREEKLLQKDQHRLWGAVQMNDAETLRKLLPKTKPAKVSLRGQTLLLLAAKKGFVDCVRELLKHPGARLDAKGKMGQTALIEAARNGHAECVAELLPHSVPSTFDRSDQNALIAAASNGKIDCVKLLMGAIDPKATAGSGLTALMAAAEFGSATLVRLLLPMSDPMAVSSRSQTALGCALAAESVECVEILAPISNIAQKNARGKTLLEWAFLTGSKTGANQCADVLALFEEPQVAQKALAEHGAERLPRLAAREEARAIAAAMGMASPADKGPDGARAGEGLSPARDALRI